MQTVELTATQNVTATQLETATLVATTTEVVENVSTAVSVPGPYYFSLRSAIYTAGQR